jgi:hypothetical protein
MLRTFAPGNPATSPCSADPRVGVGVAMVSGSVYDVEPEWAARIVATVPGVDGAPCLIPVGRPAVDAAADFIAAISTPTPHNPETPNAAVADSSAPVKRKPGRPKKSA